MKRLSIILLSVFLLLFCSCSRNALPTVSGCSIEQVKGLAWGEGGVSTDVTLKMDVSNPSSGTFAVESGNAVIHKAGGAQFATVELSGSASIGPKEDAEVSLPLKVTLTNPLALLASGGLSLDGIDPSQFTADVEVRVRKGVVARTIREKDIPLDRLLGKFSTAEK